MTTTPTAPPAKARGPRSRFRRRVSGALALGVALLTAGGLYTLLAPQPQVAQAQDQTALLAKGEQLYNGNCVTCHGANLQGIQDRGPSLVGVGDAAVWFQVSTGRMPMARQEAQAERKTPHPEFNPHQADPEKAKEAVENLDALGAYVQANGGGPEAPTEDGAALRGPDPSRGGELFRLNCASCHNFTGRGGALSSGKFAPTLDKPTEKDIYTAMLTGPQNMPKFSDRQLTPEEKKNIIAYVKSVTNENNNPGGNPLGGIGPVSEGVITFVFGVAVLIGFALWLGAKK